MKSVIFFTRFQLRDNVGLRAYTFGVFLLGLSEKRKPSVGALGQILLGVHFATSYTPTKTTQNNKEVIATCMSI